MTVEPRISVITVCFNAQRSIEATVRSVLAQTYANIEYIVIDGRSTDNTLAIVEKYQGKIAKIISEKDNGIYDAMNKGVRHATGDVVYFLNADDRFYDDNVIAEVAAQFKNNPGLDIVYGKVQGENFPANVKFSYERSFIRPFKSRRDLLKTVLCHQRIFPKKELFHDNGIFDVRYKVYADYDWLLRNYRRGANIKFFDRFVTYYDCQGASFRSRRAAMLEKARIICRNFAFFDFLFYLVYATLRSIKRGSI